MPFVVGIIEIHCCLIKGNIAVSYFPRFIIPFSLHVVEVEVLIYGGCN